VFELKNLFSVGMGQSGMQIFGLIGSSFGAIQQIRKAVCKKKTARVIVFRW